MKQHHPQRKPRHRKALVVAAMLIVGLHLSPPNAAGLMVIDQVGIGKVKPLCIDADGDGLSDQWQTTLLDGRTGDDALPSGDPDQDGFSNDEEFIAGTDPDDAASRMRILLIDLASEAGSDLSITWEGGGIIGPTQYLAAGDAPARTFYIQGGAAQDGAMSVQGSIDSQMLTTNVWIHTNALLNAGTTQRFYRVAVSFSGSGVTNSQEWGVFTQPREDSSRYLVSVPLDFGTNNTLDASLGAHLARGLHAGATDDAADQIEFRTAAGNYQTCYLRDVAGEAVWYYQGNPATNAIAPGDAFWITRKSGARARTNMVLISSCPTNTSVSIAFTTNNASLGWDWKLFGWPYSKAGSFTGSAANELGLASLAYGGSSVSLMATQDKKGDQIWVWNDDTQKWRYYWLADGLSAELDGKWIDPKTGSAAVFDLSPGKGYFFRHNVSTTGTPYGTNFTWEVAQP